uniref:Uncharacterized protein n=1 Tax=Anopheles coluzzii TaxID=1518534 RepID=A0A8W7PKL0_ANOCL
MELLLLPTLLLLSSASLADTYQGSRVSYSTILSGQYVEFFSPFSLCGSLTNFTEQDAQNTITNVGLNESQCAIGCVNKTNDAFRIGIYACGKGADSFTLPISLTDMEFMVDYTDELFVTRGQHGKLRIELHLKPNLTCLQRANVVCIRITKVMKLPFFLTIISGTLVLCSGTETMWDLCCLRQYLGGWPVAQFKPFAVCGKVSNLRVSRSTLYVSYVQPGLFTVIDLSLQTEKLCDPESTNGTFLMQYKPFEFCSKVTHISSPLLGYMDIHIPPLSSGCFISCVKRTRPTVTIEMVDCASDIQFIPSLFFARMEFYACFSEGEIILHGFDSSYWIEFTLRPDVDCLRGRFKTICTRILTYTMKYSSKLKFRGVNVGTLNMTLNKRIWRALAKNNATLVQVRKRKFH